MRTRMFPVLGIAEASTRSPSGKGVPSADHTRPKACSTSATAGPVSFTPVSRQGGTPFAGFPTHLSAVHSPETKATRPSTHTDFRWSRCITSSGRSGRKGLKQRTSTPAARRWRQNFRELRPVSPNQS